MKVRFSAGMVFFASVCFLIFIGMIALGFYIHQSALNSVTALFGAFLAAELALLAYVILGRPSIDKKRNVVTVPATFGHKAIPMVEIVSVLVCEAGDIAQHMSRYDSGLVFEYIWVTGNDLASIGDAAGTNI